MDLHSVTVPSPLLVPYMKIRIRTAGDDWSIVQRTYATRCKTEILLTNLVVNWFNTEKDKSLEKLDKLIDGFLSGKVTGKIIKMRGARGRYLTEPYEREFEIILAKPNRFPFIQIGEPFKK